MTATDGKKKMEVFIKAFKRTYSAEKKKRAVFKKKYGRIKCDCGHYLEDHFQQGWCTKCACTWYWPNHKYILRQKAKAKK